MRVIGKPRCVAMELYILITDVGWRGVMSYVRSENEGRLDLRS